MNNADSRYVALVALLEDWASWQSGYSPKLGYPSRAAVIATSASSTFEDMCDSLDADLCRAVDTAVYDLSIHHRSAIMRRYMAAVFRFPRLDYQALLQQAHEELLDKLIRRHVII